MSLAPVFTAGARSHAAGETMSLRPLTVGPWEPEGFRAVRDAYWRRRVWLTNLECRIQMTDSGLEWLMRVKGI